MNTQLDLIPSTTNPTEKTAMKIRNLKISNFRRVQSLELNLDGKSAILSGSNGCGKSSVIDSVWIALTGKDAPEAPIHTGAHKAEVQLDIGEYRVSRSWSASGASLKVHAIPGMVAQKSPQTLLDKVIGDISFDPFEFIQSQPKVQKSTLMTILGLDFADLDARKRQALDAIARAKASHDAIARQIEGIDVPETPVSRVDISDLLAQADRKRSLSDAARQAEERARKACSQIGADQAEIAAQEERIAAAQARIAELRDRITESEETRLAALASNQDLQAQADAIGDPMEAIRSADATNRTAQAQAQRAALRLQLAEDVAAMDAGRAEAARVEEEREARIACAQFPVPGLSFSDDGVLFEGLPLSDKQLSTAKVIEIGIGIAISRNPGLRICRIKDGSLLDSSTTERVLETCRKHGFQVLVERVGDGDLHAEILEDGAEEVLA